MAVINLALAVVVARAGGSDRAVAGLSDRLVGCRSTARRS
jgi:hypothetical protein